MINVVSLTSQVEAAYNVEGLKRLVHSMGDDSESIFGEKATLPPSNSSSTLPSAIVLAAKFYARGGQDDGRMAQDALELAGIAWQ